MEANADQVTFEVKTDVDGLATELENLMSDNLFMPVECCIFRVPTILSRHNEKAYAPNAFSVGPFYYKRRPLMEATQKIKLKYLRGLIARSQSSLKDFIEAVTKVQEVARKYYAGPIDMTMKEFVKVMVLDGCFIIELFRKKPYEDLREKDDPIFEMSSLLQFLSHDLIMLENQIPWLVLDILFDLTLTHIDEMPLIQLTTEFFGTIFSTAEPSIDPQLLLSRPHDSKHILDMLRNSLLWSYPGSNTAYPYWKPMPSVTSLKEAGIKFKKGNSESILDIKFDNNGVLEIPSLLIKGTTEPLFQNLISLEQWCPSYEPVITSYTILLDNLIKTKEDVEILSQNGVLENWLNIEEATQFFNKLYTDTNFKANYHLQLSDEVNKYCKRWWPKYRRLLMGNYKKPAYIAVGGAIFFVICTFLQTLFTIIK